MAGGQCDHPNGAHRRLPQQEGIKGIGTLLGEVSNPQLSEPICDKAVSLLRKYRLSHGILIPDALIAVTALYLGFPFVSKNQRDYRFIPPK